MWNYESRNKKSWAICGIQFCHQILHYQVLLTTVFTQCQDILGFWSQANFFFAIKLKCSLNRQFFISWAKIFTKGGKCALFSIYGLFLALDVQFFKKLFWGWNREKCPKLSKSVLFGKFCYIFDYFIARAIFCPIFSSQSLKLRIPLTLPFWVKNSRFFDFFCYSLLHAVK